MQAGRTTVVSVEELLALAATAPVAEMPLSPEAEAALRRSALFDRLYQQREVARRRAINAQLGMILVALPQSVIFAYAPFIYLLLSNSNGAWLGMALVAAALLSYAVMVLLTNKLLFNHYCRLEKRRLLQVSERQLRLNEELLRAFQSQLPSVPWGAAAQKMQFQRLTSGSNFVRSILMRCVSWPSSPSAD